MYTVYWLEGYTPNSKSTELLWEPHHEQFDSKDMTGALNKTESLRIQQRTGAWIKAVTFVCEHPDQIGTNGVASVENGLTPQGQTYDWKKRR